MFNLTCLLIMKMFVLFSPFFCYHVRLRWPSFQISHRLSHSIASLQITNQTAGQLSLLQKFSLLRLTAIMEKYSLSNKHGWTWYVLLLFHNFILGHLKAYYEANMLICLLGLCQSS